ncbi:MAG: hypothetical protein LBJ20_05125 [Candidatus Methanoplasma sp.]|jgi:hypothetical protein|nr:hypothetical protein [Candidatus Methanoplasma sp.]
MSVGFWKEYKSAPDIFTETMTVDSNWSESKIMEIAGEMLIEKAPVSCKSDVYINGNGYSLKSTYGANSALVNHTNRIGFERVCRETGADIAVLDSIIDNYWKLRESGDIREDVSNSDPASPFQGYKEYFRPILEYFLFVGSGSRRSKNPADYILEFGDPFDNTKWKIITKREAIDVFWPKLVFSMRSKKGMPPNYDLDYRGPDASSIAKWVRNCRGEYKGALHIRVAEGRRRRY